jgi:PleD family two-component response regulator
MNPLSSSTQQTLRHLTCVSPMLSETCRDLDTAARYGGEELGGVLPDWPERRVKSPIDCEPQ